MYERPAHTKKESNSRAQGENAYIYGYLERVSHCKTPFSVSCFWLAYLIQADTVNFNTPENSDRKLSQVTDYKKICQTYWKDRDYGNHK